MGSSDRLLINKLPTPVCPLLPMEMKATRVLKTSTYQLSTKFDQVRGVLAMGKVPPWTWDSSSDSDIRQARVALVSVRVSDVNSIALFPTERRPTPAIMALRVKAKGGSSSLSFSLSNLGLLTFTPVFSHPRHAVLSHARHAVAIVEFCFAVAILIRTQSGHWFCDVLYSVDVECRLKHTPLVLSGS